ncbi:sensor histidine kinase [Actinoplanes sp. ATCC 53533]|uniref:sensor histidine kinase n=1 Tax=Actinoplanes sp. ATCC 53533 TaxID=1288362 RepID=UPI000F7AE4B5|nr:histidine kinase [Actinoplanes sp. ATCC 53533]RSM52181.1 sensor histidine kinase [Actinoplanes sp. ATCC 53533]
MKAMAWWRSRSQAARFDLCVRATFYVNLVAVPLLVWLGIAAEVSMTAAWVLAVLITAHTVLCLLLVRAGLEHYLGRRPLPARLLAASVAATLAGTAAAVLAFPNATPGMPDGPANGILLVLVVSLMIGLSATVRPRAMLAAGAVACAATYSLSAAQGASSPAASAVGLAAAITLLTFAFRVSVWMLGVVWELDRSRQVQASLAVAEERLRFARDLHDVVGRTLSTVALKAELAAQLAKRGRDEAIDEMLEVRRIAQDSLVELRAVVGGYRTADLDVELAGARSLLASAGIECRVIGDGSGLPAEIQGTLGWVVREGTTNVLRHSEARTCTITLRVPSGDAIALTLENDGVAGGPAAIGDRVRFGSGLIGLAERIAGLGGEVVAERRRPDGFRLTARLPLPPTADEEGPA